MATKKEVTPEDVVKSFKDEFKTKIKDTRIEKHTAGTKKNQLIHIWMTIDKSILKNVVKHLMTFEKYPHLAVVSGYDNDKTINLIYHFSLYFGTRYKEMNMNITVELPKANPVVDTITDLIPGALITEQEKQEMLGVKVKNIPKDRRVFISDDFPKGIYPWRKDDKGAESMARNLHEVKK